MWVLNLPVRTSQSGVSDPSKSQSQVRHPSTLKPKCLDEH